MYSNPPLQGAHLVADILGDSTLKQRWYKEVRPHIPAVQSFP